jgi:hypothetical protein
MFLPAVQACGRCLQGLMLAAVLSHPGLLAAQEPVVSYALLKPHWRPAAADSGKMFLILKIEGVPEERLRTLKHTDVVIADSENRTYRAEAVAIPARDGQVSAIVADRCYLFTVPSGNTIFELRLPNFAPVRFTATFSPEGHCEYT